MVDFITSDFRILYLRCFLIQLNSKKPKQSNLKMGRGSEWTFFQRWHIDGQHLHEKVLNIINQGNVNQNHYTLVRMVIIKKTKIISAGENTGKREPLCTVGGNINWYSHFGKQYGNHQKLKNRSSIWPSNSTSGYLSEQNKNTNLKRYMHSHVHYNII